MVVQWGHKKKHIELCTYKVSGGSRPSDKGEPGHPDPEMKRGGTASKKSFSALGASFSSKNKGGPGLFDVLIALAVVTSVFNSPIPIEA